MKGGFWLLEKLPKGLGFPISEFFIKKEIGVEGGILSGMLALLILVLVCLGAAALAVVIFQAAGSLLGGIMLLFLVVTAQHFLAGGFLPTIFLPEAIRYLAPGMPSAILMAGVQMALTKAWSLAVTAKLLLMLLVCFLLTVWLERKER